MAEQSTWWRRSPTGRSRNVTLTYHWYILKYRLSHRNYMVHICRAIHNIFNDVRLRFMHCPPDVVDIWIHSNYTNRSSRPTIQHPHILFEIPCWFCWLSPTIISCSCGVSLYRHMCTSSETYRFYCREIYSCICWLVDIRSTVNDASESE